MSVIAVNSWMNQPGGFTLKATASITSVNPWQVFFNHAALYEMPHMILAAYMVAGFLVAGVYAVGHPARPPRPLPLRRLRYRVRAGRDADPVPDLRRRYRGPRDRQ